MSNPVFNRLERDWQKNASVTKTHPYGPNGELAQPGVQYDQEAFRQAEAAYRGPSATAVETGRMTYDDVIVKTGLSLAVLVAGAFVSWMVTIANPSVGMVLMIAGLVIGLILAMVNIFSKQIRPAMVLAYSGAQGVALGALSSLTEMVLPGVVFQAVIATVIVFGITLLLFTSGKVRNSPKLMKFTLISLLGIIGSRLLIWMLAAFGVGSMEMGAQNVTVMGLPLSVLISLFAVVIGALCLIGDFDQVKVGVESGAPAKYAWASAFGIMVTVVWLYVEILNLLSQLNSR